MQFEIEYELRANSWRRLANYIIDVAVRLSLTWILGMIIGALTYLDIYGPFDYVQKMSGFENLVLTYIIAYLYYFVFETLTGGRTLGKYITNTKVLTWYGERPTAGQIAKRSLCRIIPFNAFSFLAENPLGWHDSLSGTVVVDINKYNEELSLRQGFQEIGMPAE
ncbi:RDD family protein [Flavobacterium akiainvivens]|uniref:RDD family protein n=1 Tax=Flavobacterium akiainvivens TaxID=1202724 RepID=UPI0006C83289|nr:RDD family protein [Flavobacterium akiainvivens]SFQ74676.1 Uncharacterized membrane protein YckC, RDD family [Flavobacterium akiainvivens]